MARWRLTQKHYLNVPGTTFEYKETVLSGPRTGKEVRKTYLVPLLLDPTDLADQNYPGMVVVGYEDRCQANDYIFLGAPTPDMEPLDEEAQVITGTYEAAWGRAFVDTTGEANYSDRLVRELADTLASFNKTTQPSSPVKDPEIEALKVQVAFLTQALEIKKEEVHTERRI